MADGDIEVMLSHAVSRRIAVGDAVFDQGSPASHFFLLLNGRLKVSQVTPQGEQVIVRMVNPGDLFGIAKALQRTDYPGTALCVSEAVALCWPMDLWSQMIEQNPRLAVTAMTAIGQRLQEAHTRIREISTEDVERRVAHAVLRLSEQAGREEGDGLRIDFPITRQDIAELTGTTLHTVSRILSAWEGRGLVTGGRQKLLVRDVARLRALAENEKSA
ncbi:Crp/Fnr family transcriptional regulator [Neorhizobium huautlense]